MLSIGVWILIAMVSFCLLMFIANLAMPYILVKEHDHDFLNPQQQLIGLIYGVLLAFIVVLSWQNYATLNASLQDEATGLLDVWRDSYFFENEEKKGVESAILNYVESIHSFEWPQMKRGEITKYNPAYINLWKSLKNIEPKTEVQKDFLSALISELNGVNKARRTRLSAVESNIPSILWIFLIVGGIYIIGFTVLYQKTHIRLRMMIALIQTFIVIFCFYLISNFNHPFEGVLEVSDSKFNIVTETITDPNRAEVH